MVDSLLDNLTSYSRHLDETCASKFQLKFQLDNTILKLEGFDIDEV